jgi:signal recognition particle subunit SEC65
LASVDKQKELFGLRVVVNDQLPRGAILLSSYPALHVETDHVQTVRDAVEISNLRHAVQELRLELLSYQSKYPARCFRCGHGEVLADTVRVLQQELSEITDTLKKACDRDWKDEDARTVATIASNAIYWRNREIENLKAAEAKRKQIEDAEKAEKIEQAKIKAENFYAPEWHQP